MVIAVPEICALVAVVIGLGTSMFWTWRRRQEFGPLVVIGSFCWVIGLAVNSCLLILGHPMVPGPGHLIWALAVPVIAIGSGRSRQARARVELPTRLEPLEGRTVVVEIVMIVCAWATVVWQFALSRHPEPASVGDLMVLATIAVELSLYATLVVFARDMPVVEVGVRIAAVLTVVACDLVAARLSSVPEHLAILPFLLVCLVWLLGVSSSLVVGRTRPRPQRTPGDNERGATMAFNMIVPLGLLFAGLAREPHVDGVVLTLTTGVVLAYGAREMLRSRRARQFLEELAVQARRDPLTGLGNRRGLEEQLTLLRRQGICADVMTVDVDRFKEVNTQFGHVVGDAVLVAVARALDGATRPAGATAYRLGGDEFVVVDPTRRGEVLAEVLREQVQARTAAVPALNRVGVTLSIGVAGTDPSDDDHLDVLARTAQVLRIAKTGRDRQQRYTPEIAADLKVHGQLQKRLRRAIDTNTLTSAYQPIIEMRTGRVAGLESLTRWHDAELGPVSPVTFIPAAEQSGLIHELGEQAIARSLATLTDLDAAGHHVAYMSVNVSPVQLRRTHFVRETLNLLAVHAISPSRLTLEVTEGIFMATDDPAVTALNRLAEAGIQLAIDDFGSGYSSLGYLSRLPIQIVKVDRTLTQQADQPRTRSLVRALIEVAAAHDLVVVMEGVETERNAAALTALGATFGQGWLWEAACGERELADLLVQRGVAGRDERRSEGTAERPGTLRDLDVLGIG